MSITASEMTPADIAAVTNNNGNGGFGGFGGDGAWWLLVLLFAMNGGWFGGNRGGQGGGYGAGAAGGNELYPWINQSQQVNDGFRDQMLQTNVQGIQQSINALSTQLCNCCGDMQMALANGFAGVEQGANARQMANMNQAFGAQTAMMQGFNSLGSQLADCCCENRLATANLNSTIISENCADREALNNIGRDIIAAQTAGTQRILDQLCNDKIDAKNEKIADLERQLTLASLRESQTAQNAFIAQGLNQEVDALYNRLSNCPVPTTPVYGRTPIFTCPNNNNGCGCGCGMNG